MAAAENLKDLIPLESEEGRGRWKGNAFIGMAGKSKRKPITEGDEVEALQNVYNTLVKTNKGFREFVKDNEYPGRLNEDGICGWRTSQAIKAIQEFLVDKNILHENRADGKSVVDGMFGVDTRDALQRYLSKGAVKITKAAEKEEEEPPEKEERKGSLAGAKILKAKKEETTLTKEEKEAEKKKADEEKKAAAEEKKKELEARKAEAAEEKKKEEIARKAVADEKEYEDVKKEADELAKKMTDLREDITAERKKAKEGTAAKETEDRGTRPAGYYRMKEAEEKKKKADEEAAAKKKAEADEAKKKADEAKAAAEAAKAKKEEPKPAPATDKRIERLEVQGTGGAAGDKTLKAAGLDEKGIQKLREIEKQAKERDKAGEERKTAEKEAKKEPAPAEKPEEGLTEDRMQAMLTKKIEAQKPLLDVRKALLSVELIATVTREGKQENRSEDEKKKLVGGIVRALEANDLKALDSAVKELATVNVAGTNEVEARLTQRNLGAIQGAAESLFTEGVTNEMARKVRDSAQKRF